MSFIHRINNVLDYIEENITKEISYKKIACIAECSVDSFLRIFSYIAEQSIADYIRSRRLTRAAFDIVNSNEKIIDIAMQYGYTSPDSFTKAFHRFHEILPSEARAKSSKIRLYPKLTLQTLPNNLLTIDTSNVSLQSKKGGLQMDVQYLQTHIMCSEEEKLCCMDMVNKILKLSELARKYGLLKLEEECLQNKEMYQSELLQLGIQFIVDGADPEHIRTILENYLITSSYHGKKFLESVLIIEGILSIQQGYNTHLLEELLCSYFGIGFRKTFMKHCIYINLSVDLENKYKNQSCLSEKTSLLSIYVNMDARSMQRLLRELDIETVSIALWGSDEKIVVKMLENMSKRTAQSILYNMDSIKPSENDIMNAQNEIIKVVAQLKKQGEIIWN